VSPSRSHTDTLRPWTREELAGAAAQSFVLEAEIQSLRADLQRLEEALAVYANPQHWGISRDDLNHRVISWIGPGAAKAGMPYAMETARAALDALHREKPQ